MLRFAALAVLLLTLLPQTTRAEEKYNRDASHYGVRLEGTNKLRFTIPTYEKRNYDCWDTEVYVYITPTGGARETLLYLKSEEDISGSDYAPNVTGWKGVEGTMVHERDRGYSNYTITGINQSQTWAVPCVSEQEYTRMNVVWTVPAKFRGRDVTISWSVKTDGNLLDKVTVDVSATTLRIPSAEEEHVPMIMDPVLAYDAAHAGQQMVMYMLSASNIESVRAYYDDVNGSVTTRKETDLGTNSSGQVYLPADHRIQSFRIEAKYRNNEDDPVATQSPTIDLPLLHTAQALTAEMQTDGSARLTWSVPWTRWTDIAPNDMWEVQRNTSGNSAPSDPNWRNIGQTDYDLQRLTYAFTDDNLLQNYEGKTVYYRVRRMNTATWNWVEGSGYALTSLPATLALPTVTAATAERARTWTEASHPVALNFAIGGPEKDGQGRMILRSAQDWKKFAELVNGGQNATNAIMAADIDLGDEPLVMVGTKAYPYAGTFDGNGHALTFNPKDTLNETYYAPFRYVGSTTIRKLHTQGHLVNRQKFTAGLIGWVADDAAAQIESCRSSVDVDCTVSGDASNGGFVANASYSQSVTLRYCLFDGRLSGESCYNNGGMVGWSRGRVVIEYSLFAPIDITTQTNGCQTFARVSEDSNLTLTQSYYTTAYNNAAVVTERDSQGRYVLRSPQDWLNFSMAVQLAGGETDVNAIMYNDFTVTTSVGTETAPYRGTFDGNGHTLYVDLSGERFEAPFQYAKGYTIKGLEVRGHVYGGQHASALVGRSDYVQDQRNVISSCRVKAQVTCSSTHVGGFIGHNEESNTDITNCLFDGALVCTEANNNYGGAFIGWEQGGNSNRIQNCLERGDEWTYQNIKNIAMNWTYNNGSRFSYGNMGDSKNNWAFYATEGSNPANSAIGKSLSELVTLLGTANWYNVDEFSTSDILPRVSPKADYLPVSQGKAANLLSTPELLRTFNMGTEQIHWAAQASDLVPVATPSASAEHQTLLWDDRAKVVLTTEKRTIPDLNNFRVINDENDWGDFVMDVFNARGKKDINAVLNADLTLDSNVQIPYCGGLEESFYRGTFDGQGHTITVSIRNTSNQYGMAPFVNVGAETTIRNLNVKGTVSSGCYPTGLVSKVVSGGNLTIQGCRVMADITLNANTKNQETGGFVGQAENARITVRDCRFDGTITCPNPSKAYVGYFISPGCRNSDCQVISCLNYGAASGVEQSHKAAYFDASYRPQMGVNCLSVDYGSELIGRNPLTVLDILESKNWQIDTNGNIVPIQVAGTDGTDPDAGYDYIETRELTTEERESGSLQVEVVTPCLDHSFRFHVEPGDASLPLFDTRGSVAEKQDEGELKYYIFENNVQLDSIKADTLQSSVSLEWTTRKGVEADFYRILRYDKMVPERIDTLEAEYTQTAYIDQTVRPQHDYTYTIEAVTRCEGEHVSSLTVDGCCKKTGLVRGYVRLANGIGLPDLTVTATPVGITGGVELSCVTDSSGYFEIDSLIYQREGTYTLQVGTDGAFPPQTVTFDEISNLVSGIVFTSTLYYDFSGFVLYEDSSIPVSGVQFLRDGVPVVDAKGNPVTTNTQGAFTVSIPQGTHTIQAVKEGHRFLNDGYYIDLDKESANVNWQKDLAGVYLWDQTRVTLRGRVVGGNDQGLLPLGKSLSRNNLGDDLTIVFQLEGDNTSWIVRDQKDDNITERHYSIAHGKDCKDTTLVDAYRHRIVVHPDSATGEYQIPMYPVKFKVTEVYATGYPTLFQTGTVSETLDLGSYIEGDTATWSRIYHALPTLDIWQFTGGQDRFYGVKQYTARDNAGGQDTIYLWRKDVGYTLGHPVFMAGSPVPMLLSAREEYYYNNEVQGAPDVVSLHSGRIIVGNGLVSVEESEELELDSLGQATYIFTPQNLTFQLEDDMALRTLKFTLEHDGSFYDINPIKGYVMASQAQKQGRHILAGQNVHLVDILRDPPGSGSSAYIEKGSKMSYSYSADLSAEAGLSFSLERGEGANYYTGIWVGVGSGSQGGNISSTDKTTTVDFDLTTKYYTDWSYEYELETKEKISTSDDVKEVGMNSDVYIGVTDNILVEDAIAVRAVGSEAMKRLRPGMGGTMEVGGHDFDVSGTAKVLARGWDPVKEDSVYLVRDEVLSVSTNVNTTFVHSQSYLLEELIPSLLKARNALLLDMSVTPEYAQQVADQTGMPAYRSTVAADDDHFSSVGYYQRFVPKGQQDVWGDTIQVLNSQVWTWAGFIAANEKEKLQAMDLVKTYDFDGRTNVEYSESFTTTEGLHRYVAYPGVSPSFGGSTFEWMGDSFKGNPYESTDKNGETTVKFYALGTSFSLTGAPKVGFDFNYLSGKETGNSKETGFTLACSRKSSLTVAVYRTRELGTDSIARLAELGGLDLFYKNVEDNLSKIYGGQADGVNALTYLDGLSSTPRYRNFVFRTLAGATASPWEEERRTMFYNPGTILDQATQQINKLRIWAEEPSVSNVPYGEPARFTIYLTNEGEMPERITNGMNLYAEESQNPKGAKIFIDGMPLTGAGRDIWMDSGVIYEKHVEVYAGEEYDYEDLGISIMDVEDVKHICTVNLSAHFVPAAGKVNISTPGDKWVVNTESPYDSDRQGYYLPVHIDGYNINFRNFDHIELQYKLSTQGDKDWVNVCSYYPNTEEGKRLMALASGERKLMEHDGYIDATFYGENDPVEQRYDLRAVCYCRHGNGYLTNASNILTGIKDTRRPQPFGTPQPTNGILGIGDDIRVPFSEQIAGNYLSEVNNFEVLGLTNQSSISLATALQFNGQGAAVSLSNRNLAGKDFTLDLMLKPRQNGNKMTVLTHSMDESAYLNLGVTADSRLWANVNGIEMLSTEAVNFEDLHHVAYVFDVDEEENLTNVTFYDGTKAIGRSSFEGMYDGTSNLVLGNNFEGEMLEVRLWNKAMTSAELGTYAQKRLTGYELGLLDNYPMNEGSGDYAYDKAVGSNDLRLVGTTWKVPDGISMKLDGTEGIRLNPNLFNRTDYEDYTLMLWFRTSDLNATLMSNGEARDEAGYKNHFNIGLEDGTLFFRSGGQQVNASGYYHDGSWHHLAVSVNRPLNVGRLYVDEKLEQTFPVDTLGGIGGNALMLGATYYSNYSDYRNYMTGHIDEVAMFEMALPENVLKLISKNSPSGEEMGLLAYLPFSRSERQLDNSQRLMPTGLSLRKYKDNHGNIVESHVDTIVSQEIVYLHADRKSYAPMVNAGKLENIKYSYVAKDNELYINLDVPDYQIEKTNVYVTVKEVADLQGNLMASPLAMDLYVYRNPLRWNVKRKTVDMLYGEGTTVEVAIENLSGKTKDYTLEGLPQWITASQTSGKIGPLDEEPVTLTISPYINIGDFEEVIYIVGENGMTEPLTLSIRVRGEAPGWTVDDQLKAGNVTMHMVTRVMVGGEVAHDTDDILTAIGSGHRTLGTANVKQGTTENDGLVYLTVYNTANANGTPVHFEFYDASTGRIYVVEKNNVEQANEHDVPFVADTILFQADAILGTATNPVVLYARQKEVQTIRLEKGWNWASTYVQPGVSTVTDLMDGMATWEIGDAVELMETDGQPYLITYKSIYDPMVFREVPYWDKGEKKAHITPQCMYRFYSQNPKNIYISGENVSYEGITVHQGWNRIGYLSPMNLPIATALSDYTDAASEGDIIKSQSEFAILSIDASGNRLWKGTLEYLRTGEGYMLKRNASSEHTFWYPYYSTGTKYNNVKSESINSNSKIQNAPLFRNTTGSSMNVIARVEGIELMDGDLLVAYDDLKLRGVAEVSSKFTVQNAQLLFLNIGRSEEAIRFAIERDGEIVATTSQRIPYLDNAVHGSLDEPMVINFIAMDGLDSEGWYDLSGRHLNSKPYQKGVYIHNGQKVTIR